MYVHVRQEGRVVYLGYWWFLQYNTSPWRTEVNCLPGLTFGGLSCHDHQGDWEGVTVALELKNPLALDKYAATNVTPRSVAYDSHGKPIRWPWSVLDMYTDADGDEHPGVFVAAGSHAGYSTRCTEDECSQTLAGKGLPDGGFSGEDEWRFNDAGRCASGQKDEKGRELGPCLAALPSTRDGRAGVLWNAFPGAWGKATCTVIGKICSTIEGPQSPSKQKRFRQPQKSTAGSLDVLRDQREEYGRRPDPRRP